MLATLASWPKISAGCDEAMAAAMASLVNIIFCAFMSKGSQTDGYAGSVGDREISDARELLDR